MLLQVYHVVAIGPDAEHEVFSVLCYPLIVLKFLILFVHFLADKLANFFGRGLGLAPIKRTLQVIVPVLFHYHRMERVLEAIAAKGVTAGREFEDDGLGHHSVQLEVDLLVADLANELLAALFLLAFGLFVFRLLSRSCCR